jgi:hypothetical protein
MAARTRVTPKKRRQFLELLADGHAVKHAAMVVRLSRQEMYRERDADSAFAVAWDAAVDEGTEALEQEARRRAVDGVQKPVYHLGRIVDTVREYSDTLLIFLLKARAPQKYRESVDVRHSGTVKHEHYDLTKLNDTQLGDLERVLAAAAPDTRRN